MRERPDKIAVTNLYKVFGDQPDLAMALLRQGVSKDDIFKETRQTVGVNDVSFTVGEGEIFVAMGLSGSGKSTLVRCVNRLIEPTEGSVSIDGEDVLSLDADALRRLRLHKIAMVFQHFALFPHRSVVENAGYGLKVRGMGAAERRGKALEALAAVGLEAWADSPPSSLSGGMQQRVGLARALAVDPEILLMDEPFSALDPLIRRDMQQELLALQERYRSTIVFITHDLHEALTIGSRIAIMKDGSIVQCAEPTEIVGAPANAYVANFTQDVDRSRILTLGGIARRGRPHLSPKQGAAEARRQLLDAGVQALLVADADDKPLGSVTAVALLAADPAEKVEALMHRPALTAEADTPLAAIFEAGADGHPVALVDSQGRIEASVDPGDLMAALGMTVEPRDAADVPAPDRKETLHG